MTDKINTTKYVFNTFMVHKINSKIESQQYHNFARTNSEPYRIRNLGSKLKLKPKQMQIDVNQFGFSTEHQTAKVG